MNQARTTLTNFFICFRFFFRKTILRPALFILGIVIPLAWTAMMAYLVHTLDAPAGSKTGEQLSFLVALVPGTLFIGTFFTSVMSLPNNLSLDRIHNRLKIYLTLGINQYIYLAGNIFGLFSIYFPVFLIQLFGLNFALKIYFSASILLAIIAINIVVFLLMCLLGIFISTFPKTDKSSHAINSLTIVLFLILTGLIIPAFLFDPSLIGFDRLFRWIGKTRESAYAWPKFIQFLTPIGTGIYFVQRIIIFEHTNSNVNLCSWDVDWIGIALQLGLGVFIYLTCVKRFKWK